MAALITVSGTLARVIAPLGALAGAAGERALRQGLAEGGNKTRTVVRKALKNQMGVKRYGTIVNHTSGALHAEGGGLAYVIRGVGSGLPIREFPVRVTRSGVSASPWQEARTFKRSFEVAGSGVLRARTTRKRHPLRALYGPSPAKEIAKDAALEAFQASVRVHVAWAINKRLNALVQR